MTSAMPQPRAADAGMPKIGGSFGGFIALVVILSLFILLSLAAVIYLIHTRPSHDNFEDVVFFPTHRDRNASMSTTATAQTLTAYNKPKHGREATNESTTSIKEKLAGMFRSFGTRRQGGWEATAQDEDWDDGDPATMHTANMSELGVRRVPNHAVIVQPTTRDRNVSQGATTYFDPYTPQQPYHDRSLSPRPPQRRPTKDSDDLSETSTVVAHDRPVPPPMVNTALPSVRTNQRVQSPLSRGPSQPSSPLRPHPNMPGHGNRRVTDSSFASSTSPTSFYSARMDLSVDEEGEDSMHMPNRFASPPSPVQSFDSGSRFRENL